MTFQFKINQYKLQIAQFMKGFELKSKLNITNNNTCNSGYWRGTCPDLEDFSICKDCIMHRRSRIAWSESLHFHWTPILAFNQLTNCRWNTCCLGMRPPLLSNTCDNIGRCFCTMCHWLVFPSALIIAAVLTPRPCLLFPPSLVGLGRRLTTDACLPWVWPAVGLRSARW